MAAVEADIDSSLVKLDGVSLCKVQELGSTVFAAAIAEILNRGDDDTELVAPFQNYL